MGSMSASDAAPLPRLGEIFFDVRGSSRSMRLSWYDNTGVAVFSIWQGGTCTGTFRLPMDDLTRLVDSLRRGVLGGQASENSGPIAIGGQRPRLAIGAASAEPFTGMMTALTDERAAAYGLSRGRQTGAFAAAGPIGLGDYAAAQTGGAGEQYGTSQQYSTAQLYGTEQLYSTGQYDAGQQYAATDTYAAGQTDAYAAGQQYALPEQYGLEQYGTAQQYDGTSQYGTGQQYGQYGQYGQAQQYGTDASQDGQSRPGVDGQLGDQRADYQYTTQGSTQYGGSSGYGDAAYADTGYAETGYADTAQASFAQQGAAAQPVGYGAAAQYPAQPAEPVPSYGSGPQPSFGYQSPATQQPFGDGQSSSQAYGASSQVGGEQGAGQPDAGQPGFMYQGASAGGTAVPEASHGDGTGPQSASRYRDQAVYGQSGAQSYEANGYEARSQAAPSRDGEAYAAAGYGQQGYPRAGYDERAYDEQSYAPPRRAEQAPAAPEVPAGTFGNRAYTTPGQQDAGRTSGQFQEYGYGRQSDQQDAAAAQARGQQGFAAQQSPPVAQQSPAPQQWQDGARAGQPASVPEYRNGTGAFSALSAPLPPEVVGQRSPVGAQVGQTPAGQQGSAYGTPVPEADRYATSYGEQQGYGQPSGYQAPGAQSDPTRYPGTPPPADAGNRVNAGASGPAGVGYATAAGQAVGGYQPTATGAANGYGYEQQAYTANGQAGGYGDGDRGGTGAFPAGNPATSGPGTGAYPDVSGSSGYSANGSSGYAANGYASNGYGTSGYQANGYPANGSTASEYSPGENAGRGSAPSSAYPRLPANGYAGGSQPGNGPVPPPSAAPSANGASYQAAPEYGQASPNGAVPAGPGNQVNGAGYPAPRHASQPTFTPAFTGGGENVPGEAGGSARPGQPAGSGYTPAPGYGASPSAAAPAYQATSAYANGNGAAYPAANGNGYSPANGTSYSAANGNGYSPVNGNGYPAANGYSPANEGGRPAANGNGYPVANGASTANNYQRDGYVSGQQTGPLAADYLPTPGFAPAGQRDPGQQGYWEPEQQPRGNWS